MAIAQRLRELWTQGCDVRIAYTVMGVDVFRFLGQATARGPVPKKHLVQDFDGDGEFDNYFHLKALTINGVFDGNPDGYVDPQRLVELVGLRRGLRRELRDPATPCADAEVPAASSTTGTRTSRRASPLDAGQSTCGKVDRYAQPRPGLTRCPCRHPGGGPPRRRRRASRCGASATARSTSCSTSAGSGRSGSSATPGRPCPGSGRSRGRQRCSKFLDGRTRLTVTEHVSGRVLFDRELRLRHRRRADRDRRPLGRADQPRQVRPDQPDVRHPLGAPTSRPLLDGDPRPCSTRSASAGIDAFLAYGTLLGAIRERGSSATTPTPTSPTSATRATRATWCGSPSGSSGPSTSAASSTYRYSGAAFRIDVVEGDGVVRGLDVFAGFIDDGSRLYLMGEIGADFRREWVYPLDDLHPRGPHLPGAGRARSAGSRRPTGRRWAVPDPAFKFTTPDRTVRQLDRLVPRYVDQPGRLGARLQRGPRQAAHGQALPAGPQGGSRPLRPAATVIDVGAGRGADSLWLARAGPPRARLRLRAVSAARRPGGGRGRGARPRRADAQPQRVAQRSSPKVPGWPASTGPRVMLARHVADATNRFGRESLARFASMSLRGGGRLFLDVWTGGGRTPDRLQPVALDEVARSLTAQGARILVTRERPARAGSQRSSRGRLVAQWD